MALLSETLDTQNDHSEFIAYLGNRLFIGSWHATKPKVLDYHGIDSILHIGFDVEKDHSCERTYKKVMVDDNPQSMNYLFEEILPDVLGWLDDQIKGNKKVLVCCSAGRSRSVTVVSAYLISRRGMTVEEALDFVKEKRPDANPNSSFVEGLQMFAHQL